MDFDARSALSSSSYARLLKPSSETLNHSLELTNLDGNRQLPPSTRAPKAALGKPGGKPLIDNIDLLAIATSLVCMCIAIAAVAPSLELAFKLGYTNQLVLVGLMISIMNLCMKRVVTLLFLLIEASSRKSTIQNYDAILRNSLLGSHVGWQWRTVLFLLLALPLGLSALYKRYQGGASSKIVSIPGCTYGPTGPPGVNDLGSTFTLITNATVPFLATATNDAKSPIYGATPQPYGFNTLLVSNTTAICLDAPAAPYVSELQLSLPLGSTYYLSANVLGTVSTFDDRCNLHRNDMAFWDQYNMTIQTVPIYNDYYVGILNNDFAGENWDVAPEQWDDSWIILGFTNSSEGDLAKDSYFKSNALLFNTDRHSCEGEWRITQNSILLVSGSCDSEPLNASYEYFERTQLGIGDHFGTLLVDYIGPFSKTRTHSEWLMPTFSVTIASMYWSSLANDIVKYGGIDGGWPQYDPGWWFYNSTELLTLTKPTMRTNWSLYVLFAAQPLLTIIAFVSAVRLYKLPVDRGFGMISILAGIDKDSLDVLKGATLSGDLREAVGLELTIKDDGVGSTQRIEYRIGAYGIKGRVKRSMHFN